MPLDAIVSRFRCISLIIMIVRVAPRNFCALPHCVRLTMYNGISITCVPTVHQCRSVCVLHKVQ